MNYETYVNHISAYEREFKPWEGRAEKIVKRYRDDSRSEQGEAAKFNVLWSNVQTLKAATFARTPMPDVSRRFKDNDPVGRVAGLLLERVLEFQVRHFRDYSATLGQVTYDRFLPGRGTAWVRYEPTFKPTEGEEVTEDAEADTEVGEEIADENCPVDYVHWKDFGHQVCRTWEECNIVWRKVYLSKAEAEARFPDEDLPMDSAPDEKLRSSETNTVNKQALVYEAWNKSDGEAVWLSRSLGKIIDKKDDPLGLEEFFPCPPPLYATLTTDSLVPVPDFLMYQDQANELDTLSGRIDGLVKALQIKGVYDGSVGELARLFTEGENGTLIPVKNWAAFAEKKGLGGAVDIMDIEPIARALIEAYQAFDKVLSYIYQLTGISDIVRGDTDPNETLGAQKIKNSYVGLRLKVYQDEVERFATRLLQLKAEIICNHFDPQTIATLACWEQMSPADQQSVWMFSPAGMGPDGQPTPPQPMQDAKGQMIPGPAMKMLKGGVTRSFRVEVETDSMAYQDEQQEKQDRMEFLQACGQFLQSLMQITQEAPILAPAAAEMFKFGITGFRVGKNLEGTLDQMTEQLKQMAQQAAQQPKQNPEAVKGQAAQGVAQVNAQGKAQVATIQEQEETKREAARLQADQATQRQDQAHEAQMAAIEARNQHAADAMAEQHAQQMALVQQNADKQAMQVQQMFQTLIQRMKGDTTIEAAEIASQTTLGAAQISAAKAADSETSSA